MSLNNPLTEQQAAAARSPHSLAVLAGAGTGKTHLLAERYLFHAIADGLRPTEVVALTFTHAAATEMRQRIRARAAALAASDPSVFAALPADCEILAEIDAAQICTFHSLAARLVREAAAVGVLPGVPPDFAVLEEVDAALIQAEWLDRALDSLPAELFDTVPYSRLRGILAALLGDPLTAERALGHEPAQWQAEVVRLQRQAWQALISHPEWQAARVVLGELRGQAIDKAEQNRQVVVAAMAAIESAEELSLDQGSDQSFDLSLDLGRKLGRELGAIAAIKLNSGSKKYWASEAELKEVKDQMKALREVVKTAQEEGWIAPEWGGVEEEFLAQSKVVKEAFGAVRSYLEQEKFRRKQLDFNDLELYALQALDNPEFRDRARSRWRAYLVDEFQDTNRVQGELLDRLAGPVNAADPCPVKLTIVGDEKQSIYRFRRAEVAVFRQWRDRLGQSVSLTRSFRTHATLVSHCNQVFAAELEEFEGLEGQRLDPPHAGPHLSLALPELPDEAGDKSAGATSAGANSAESNAEWQAAEAAWLADRLRTWVEEGLAVHPRGGSPTATRPVAYRDMAILTRTWSLANFYARSLRAAGLPVAIGGGDLLTTDAARDGFALLRFLADPSDSYALVALLRGPMFAVSDRALAVLAQQFPAPAPSAEPARKHREEFLDWWGGLQALLLGKADATGTPGRQDAYPTDGVGGQDGQLPASLAELEEVDLVRIVETLRALLRERSVELPSRLLQMADRATGYSAVLAGLGEGEQSLADWQAWLEFVREHEGQAGDVVGLVRRVNRLLAWQQSQPGERALVARPALEAGDAIAVMTIHGAKGLEWPVVVLPGLHGRGKISQEAVYFQADLGAAWRWRDRETRAWQEPLLYRLLRDRDRQDETAETKRLFYVALTRARDRLVLSGAKPKGAALDWLRPAIERAGLPIERFALPEESSGGDSRSQPSDLKVDREIAPKTVQLPPVWLLDRVGAGIDELPIAALSEYGRCPQRFFYGWVQGHPGRVLVSNLDSSEGAEVELGGDLSEENYFELELEPEFDLDFVTTDPAGSADRARRIGILTHRAIERDLTHPADLQALDPGLDAEAWQEAIALADRFRQAAVYQPWREVPTDLGAIRREQPVRLSFGGLVLQGVADWVGPDFVLDFKSDRRIDPPVHRFQLWAYARALGKPRAAIAFLRHDRVHVWSAEELGAIDAEAEALIAALRAGEFAARPSVAACGSCPFVETCPAAAVG